MFSLTARFVACGGSILPAIFGTTLSCTSGGSTCCATHDVGKKRCPTLSPKRQSRVALRELGLLVLAWAIAALVLGCPRKTSTTASSVASLATDVDLDLTFELLSGASPSVGVTLLVRGSSDGKTAFHFHSTEVSDPEQEIRAFTVKSVSDEPLVVAHDEASAWTVTHAPSEVLRVQYEIVARAETVDEDSFKRAIITDSLFQVVGGAGIPYVTTESSSAPLRIAAHWRGFKEASWTVASSFSVDQNGFRVTAAQRDFVDAIFIAGDVRLISRTVHDRPLWAAVAKHPDWSFTDEALIDMVVKITDAERSFFADFDQPSFLVSVIPRRCGAPGPCIPYGVSKAQSFALFLPPAMTLESTDSVTSVRRLVAHEMFHAWNGETYRGDESTRWFQEGFTRFYERRVLFRAKMMDLGAYVASLNLEVTRYELDGSKDEYVIGDIVAWLTDARIRSASQGSKSLDDLMRELLVRRPTVPTVDTGIFLAAIARYTSDDFAKQMGAIVEGSTTFTIDAGLLEPCLHARVEKSPRYDPGFDLSASKLTGIVTGLVAGSAAARAGLQDGQTVLEVSIHRATDQKATFVVETPSHEEKTLSYFPVATVSLPVFELPASALPEACGQLL